jgi:hypothetical protein
MKRRKYAIRLEAAGRGTGGQTAFILIFNFLITPVVEEVWHSEQYGEDWLEYKQISPSFL